MKCPYCRSNENWGMMSYPWMRRFPALRNRRCSNCGREFARWLRLFAIRHETARFLTYTWLGIWLAVAAVLFGVSIAWVVAWRYAQIY